MDSFGQALEAVAGALERAGIRYLIGGSVASSARGVPRMTIDVDLLVELAEEQADGLVTALGRDWYADADAIRASLRLGRPFNVIHMSSGQKFDIFPAVSEFHRAELERASRLPVGGGDARRYPVASREDILLAKLVWFRQGGEVSDRQWSDITGLAGGGDGLDGGYLEEWANRLGVRDLLDRARG
jgi:hypothetical protein